MRLVAESDREGDATIGDYHMPVNLLTPTREMVLDVQRGVIRRTIISYSVPWIVVNETLQNSLDAVQKSDVTEGDIRVNFYLDANAVEIQDNGRGFPYDPKLRLFYWGMTDKEFDSERNKLLGYQGVGLKVVMFSSSDFKFESVNSGVRWGARIRNAHQYQTRRTIPPQLNRATKTSDPSGTIIRYQFPDTKVHEFFQYVFEKYDGRVGDNLASTPSEKFLVALEHYFRIYTYAGNLDRLLNLPDAPKKSLIKMSIYWSHIPDTLPEGLKDILRSSNPPLTFVFENKHWDLEEVLSRIRMPYRRRVPSPLSFPIPPSGYPARHGPRYVYVNKFRDIPEFQSLITNTRARKAANIPYYQRHLFPRMRGIYMVIGARPVLDEYLFGDLDNQQVICAQSGVPTEHKIREPTDGGELGFLANIYFAVSTNAQLNIGKREITDPWLKGYVYRYFDDAFRLTLRDLVRAFVGRMTPLTLPSVETGIVRRQDITVIPGIAKVPHDENMVIAIFYALLGIGLFRGIKTYHLSRSTDPYDGKILMQSGGAFPQPTADTHLQTVEFKIKLSDLVHELNMGYKTCTDMELIIVWDDDYSRLPITSQLPDYGVEELVMDDLPEVTKRLICRHIPREIPVIVLQEAIQRRFGHI